MAVYNTPSDASNTAVRAFLTKVGEYYLGSNFNTGSGKGKAAWLKIRNESFQNKCGYCDRPDDKLQIEHIYMFNRQECGLHHPGNIMPCCKNCNKRKRTLSKDYCDWDEHLKAICEERNEIKHYPSRRAKIHLHMETEKYPKLNAIEKQAIKVIADSLYENIKSESEKSLNMYREFDKAFVKRDTQNMFTHST